MGDEIQVCMVIIMGEGVGVGRGIKHALMHSTHMLVFSPYEKQRHLCN